MKLTIEPTASEHNSYNTISIEHPINDVAFETLISLFKRAAIAWGFMPETVLSLSEKVSTSPNLEELQKDVYRLNFLEDDKLDIKSPDKAGEPWTIYNSENEIVGQGITFRDAIDDAENILHNI